MNKKHMLIIGMVGALLGGCDNGTKARAELEAAALSAVRAYVENVGMTVHTLELMASFPECSTHLDAKLAERRLGNPNIEIMNLKDHMPNTPNAYAFIAAESVATVDAYYCFPTNPDTSGKAAYLHGTVPNT